MEKKTDYLQLAKNILESGAVAGQDALLAAIAFALVDIAESARKESAFMAAMGLAQVALDGMGESNHQKQERIEELEKELASRG